MKGYYRSVAVGICIQSMLAFHAVKINWVALHVTNVAVNVYSCKYLSIITTNCAYPFVLKYNQILIHRDAFIRNRKIVRSFAITGTVVLVLI